jgi:hypothetical protein
MMRLWVNAALAVMAVAPVWGQALAPGVGATVSGCAAMVSSADVPVPANAAGPGSIYVEETPEQMKKTLPALRGARFESGPVVNGGAVADPADERLDSILRQSGEVIASLLHRMPNLVAKEEVTQIVDGPQDSMMYASAGRGRSSMGSQQQMPGQQDAKKTAYTYRIVATDDPKLGRVLDESRTDAHNRPIDPSVNNPDSPHSVGFSTSWLFFLQGNLPDARFRYVGRQKIGKRETYVIAFAQKPDLKHFQTVVDTGNGRCSTVLQGVAWIDEATYRIVRMQTDLLHPLPNVHVDQLRSTLNYGEVKIPQNGLLLWLPSDVEIAWRGENQGASERHQYSNYRLFGATARILDTDGKPL